MYGRKTWINEKKVDGSTSQRCRKIAFGNREVKKWGKGDTKFKGGHVLEGGTYLWGKRKSKWARKQRGCS